MVARLNVCFSVWPDCRHRGVVYLYDFSEDTAVPDHVLPICRSDYTENAGYNYNISLAMPYDAIAGPRSAL